MYVGQLRYRFQQSQCTEPQRGVEARPVVTMLWPAGAPGGWGLGSVLIYIWLLPDERETRGDTQKLPCLAALPQLGLQRAEGAEAGADSN